MFLVVLDVVLAICFAGFLESWIKTTETSIDDNDHGGGNDDDDNYHGGGDHDDDDN